MKFDGPYLYFIKSRFPSMKLLASRASKKWRERGGDMGSHRLKLILPIVALLAILQGTVHCYPTCNPNLVAGVTTLLLDLVDNTVNYGNYVYYNQYPATNPVIWGLATCNPTMDNTGNPAKKMDKRECFRCLNGARLEIMKGCYDNTGAYEVLPNCMLRFQFYPFV